MEYLIIRFGKGVSLFFYEFHPTHVLYNIKFALYIEENTS